MPPEGVVADVGRGDAGERRGRRGGDDHRLALQALPGRDDRQDGDAGSLREQRDHRLLLDALASSHGQPRRLPAAGERDPHRPDVLGVPRVSAHDLHQQLLPVVGLDTQALLARCGRRQRSDARHRDPEVEQRLAHLLGGEKPSG